MWNETKARRNLEYGIWNMIASKSFTDLEVWKVGHELVVQVYDVTKSFPKEELFGLTSQMKRSSASITSNIAEGFGRFGLKEKEQFYLIAAGSLFELKDQLLIARDVGYISPAQFKTVAENCTSCHKLLNAFITKHRVIRNSKFKIPDSGRR